MILRNAANLLRGGAPEDQVDPSSGSLRARPPVIPDGILTEMVTAQDAMSERDRINTADGMLHASSLLDMCVRQHVLGVRYNTETGKSVSPQMRIVWTLGRAAEAHARNAIIRHRGGNGIYGVWTCACGESQHLGTRPVDRTCPTCRKPLNKYKEPTLTDAELGIKGSPDMTLIFTGGWFLPVEFKSMTKKMFDELEGPKGDHVGQALLYRELLRRQGFKVLDKVVVFYVSKDFAFRGIPYKEYHVDATSQTSQAMLAAALDNARQYKEAIASGEIPTGPCRSTNDRRAKECPLVHLCFQRSDA